MWLTIAALLLAAPPAAPDGYQQRRVIKMNAERFSFTPSRIELTAGEEVELQIKSDDTAHGFHILGTTTRVVIPKRGKGETTVVVRFDKPGNYTFECHRLCGAGHDFMRGEIVVRERGTDMSHRTEASTQTAVRKR
jgi:cytochrome c oxidase subunit 2